LRLTKATASKTPPKPAKTIKIEHWDAIEDEPVEWLIDGVLVAGSFSALYGPPGSFKSFMALDIAEAIATGRSWMGREVKQTGAVLMLCGEGFGGVGARIKAIKIHHQTEDGAPIYVVRHQLNLRSSQEDFNALMLAVVTLVEETGVEFKLAIVDTLARAFGGGNENDSGEMMGFVVSMGKIQEFLKCALMVLHHSGKNAALGMRGSSSLLGAVDSELELLRFEDQMKGILTITKQKDGEQGTRFGFEMVEVEIKPLVKSLAVQASDEAIRLMSKNKGKNNSGKGINQSIEMTSLETVVKSKGIPKFIEGLQRMAVNLIDWKAEFRSKKGITDKSTSTEKSSFNKAWERAQKRLQESGEIDIRDELVWLTPFKSSQDEF
jgi:hypothetical protein